MEVPYIFVVLNTIAVIVYLYAVHVFEFAGNGVQYLSDLAFKTPIKINNDPAALPALKGRDLPNAQRFVHQRDRLTSHVIAAIIINTINYAMYPYEGLLYPWMEYIFVGACVVANLDAIGIGLALRRNKHIVDVVCTAYHDLTLRNDENNKMLKQDVEAFSKVFEAFVEELNAVAKNADDAITVIDNLKEDDEKDGKNEK